jgi:hypothetical protein
MLSHAGLEPLGGKVAGVISRDTLLLCAIPHSPVTNDPGWSHWQKHRRSLQLEPKTGWLLTCFVLGTSGGSFLGGTSTNKQCGQSGSQQYPTPFFFLMETWGRHVSTEKSWPSTTLAICHFIKGAVDSCSLNYKTVIHLGDYSRGWETFQFMFRYVLKDIKLILCPCPLCWEPSP